MTVYEKFLEDNGLKEEMYHGNTSLLFKKDGSNAWTDPVTGNGFKALSNQMLFDKAYNAGIDAAINRITMAPYNTKNADSKILFSLTMNELIELIKNQPDSELKERLKIAQTVWEDFSNSRKAEEEAT